jgi:hypothetical protein
MTLAQIDALARAGGGRERREPEVERGTMGDLMGLAALAGR